jgi:hypothetical protein
VMMAIAPVQHGDNRAGVSDDHAGVPAAGRPCPRGTVRRVR